MSNTNIVENLEALLAAVEAQPESLFDLSSFRKDTPCGSNFCTVGLACTMPRFQALGFHLNFESSVWSTGRFVAKIGNVSVYDAISGDYNDPSDASDFAFGPMAWQRLFETALSGEFDGGLGYQYDYDTETANMTDKELAIARLKKQIETLKGEAE